MEQNRIIFYGNLPKPNSKHNAGGQIGNSKTLAILQKQWNAYILSRPYRINLFLFDYVFYFLGLCRIAIILFFKILKNKIEVVHISGFYFKQIYFEALLIYISKLGKANVVYELRAGGMEEAYRRGNTLYKKFFKYCVKKADILLTQGLENKNLLKTITNKEIVYYPNFVIPAYLKKRDLRKDKELLKLVYWGRIDESKNVHLMLEICRILVTNGLNCKLKIVGIVNSLEYMARLKKQIEAARIIEKIDILAPSFNAEELIKEVESSHFYLFPSANGREGHSNSLTEAMALGIVPIASTIGFNRTVINNPYLIIKSLNPEDYASRILKIWNNNEWELYSNFVSDRVRSNFTEENIASVLISTYKKLLD